MANRFRGNPVYRQFIGARNDALAQRESAGFSGGARDVYYTGPCPTADPDDQTNMDTAICSGICQDICGCCQNSCSGTVDPAVFAFYADSGTINLPAGGVFALNDSVYSIGPIDKNCGCITIGQDGRYLAIFTLTGMALANIDSLISLRINGSAVQDALADVNAIQGDTVQLVSRAAFTAECGDVLQLVSSGALALCGNPAATLTLVRIG